MDVINFLKELDVSTSANIDELTNQFNHILSWFPIETFSEPSALEFRIVLKATIFMYANLSIHERSLEEKLKTSEFIPKNALSYVLTKFNNGTLLQDVCKQLLKSATGPDHVLEVQDFCNDFLDVQQYFNILAEVRETRSLHMVENRVATEATYLLRTVFQLQSEEQIDLAIQRLVDGVEFKVLAWIINFNEYHTYLSMKSQVIQREICSRLEDGLISASFVSSMFEFVTLDENGMATYLKCLQNKMFANSLIKFFIRFLSALELQHENNKETRLKEHNRDQITFLIATTLCKKSDCRIEFLKKLTATTVNINMLLSISRSNFVYDL